MSIEQWQALPKATDWGRWSHTDLLLATLADRIAWLQWTLAAVNTHKGQPPTRPEPIPRPGIGDGPLAATTELQSARNLRAVAVLKARERLHGARPSEDDINSAMAELMGGADHV